MVRNIKCATEATDTERTKPTVSSTRSNRSKWKSEAILLNPTLFISNLTFLFYRVMSWQFCYVLSVESNSSKFEGFSFFLSFRPFFPSVLPFFFFFYYSNCSIYKISVAFSYICTLHKTFYWPNVNVLSTFLTTRHDSTWENLQLAFGIPTQLPLSSVVTSPNNWINKMNIANCKYNRIKLSKVKLDGIIDRISSPFDSQSPTYTLTSEQFANCAKTK